MNHDYAHCLYYTPNCPKECFRAQLQRDLEERRSEFIGVPLTCSHLSGTVECKLANSHKKVWKGEWIPVSERLPIPNSVYEDVFVYYLVQNEYGDMMVATFVQFPGGSRVWRQMYQDGAIMEDIVAWMPLPECYKGES